jgi:hypothetical protein
MLDDVLLAALLDDVLLHEAISKETASSGPITVALRLITGPPLCFVFTSQKAIPFGL